MVYVYHQFYGGFECSDKLKWYVIDLMDIDMLLMYDDVLRLTAGAAGFVVTNCQFCICMISFYISYISFLDVSGGLYGLGYSFWVAKGVPMSNLSRKDPAVTQELCVYGQPLPMQHGV
jgi:hypothetical protein